MAIGKRVPGFKTIETVLFKLATHYHAGPTLGIYKLP